MKTYTKTEESKKAFSAKPPESDSDDSDAEYRKVQADAEYFDEKKGDIDSDVEVINDSTKRPQGTGAAKFQSTMFNSSGRIGFKSSSGISKPDRPDRREKCRNKRDRKAYNRK